MTLMTLCTTWLGFGQSLSSPGAVPAPLNLWESYLTSEPQLPI